MPPPTPAELWAFLPQGYLLTVAIELPVLLIGLAPQHSLRTRVFSGLWLTACTYPIVVLVLPFLIWAPLGRTTYLAVAETFAPLAECALFYAANGRGARRQAIFRDCAAITLANLASFGLGSLLWAAGSA